MKKVLKTLSILLGIVALVVAVVAIPFAAGSPWTVNQFYSRALLGVLLDSPEALTDTGILRGLGLRWYEDELDDYSYASLQRLSTRIQGLRASLEGYDRPEDFEAEISYDAARWQLENFDAMAGRWGDHWFTFDQLMGAHIAIPNFVTTTHKFEDADDVRAYVARVKAMPAALIASEERGTTKVEKGFVPPDFALEKVAADAIAFGTTPAEEHVLVTRFDDATKSIDGLSSEDRTKLRAELVEAVENDVKPAWKGFGERVGELSKTAPHDAGVWRLPDGDEFYAWAIRFFTASDITPEQVHQLGLTEVARLQEEGWKILEELGVERGPSFGAAIRTLNERDNLKLTDSPEDIERVIKLLDGHIRDAEVLFADKFNQKPNNTVNANAVPAFRRETTPPAYYDAGPVDGSEPGNVYINPKFLPFATSRGMRALMAHEAIPGHHYQFFVVRQQEMAKFRQMLPVAAVSEGWGLYAEQLGDEMGYYRTQRERLGYVETRLLRAVRLVVDTGIHRKRWSREKALDYVDQNMGYDREIMSIEVDRYCVLPGQATSYYTGLTQMQRLRAKAEEKLGDKFDLAAFHDVIMTSGMIPWKLVEKRVDRWIEGGGGE